MKKRINIDFYHVESPVPFENVLRKAMCLSHGAARNEATAMGVIRLRAEGERDGLIFGDMMRIRQDEPTIVASTRGTEVSVAQREDEGLGVTNAFLYVPDRKVLLYQRNRSGVPASLASFYFQQKGGLGNAILFNPVLGEDAHNKLRRLSGANVLRVKMAPGRIAPETGEQGAIFQVAKAARQMESPVVDVSFSLGRQRNGSLNLRKVFEAINWTERHRNEGMKVDALELVAREEGMEKTEVLDLLELRFKFALIVESSKLIEEFYQRRIDCLSEGWAKCSRQIPQF